MAEHVNSRLTTDGLSLGGVQVASPHYLAISVSTLGDNSLVAADPSNKIRVLSYVITASGSVNGKWRSGTTDISGLLYMTADTGASVAFSPVGHFETAKNQALQLNLSAGTAVGGHLVYILVPA